MQVFKQNAALRIWRQAEPPRLFQALGRARPQAAPGTVERTQRILLALVALLGLGLAVATVLLLRDVRARTLEEASRTLESRALTLADQAERAFEAVWIMQSSILDMLNSAGVRTAEEFATAMAGRDVHDAMRVRMSHSEQVEALSAISHDGQLVNSSRFWPVPRIDLSDRDYFKALSHD
ncbi:MAG: hypothetical protein WCP77_21855, partial [Roseococcus sp.]